MRQIRCETIGSLTRSTNGRPCCRRLRAVFVMSSCSRERDLLNSSLLKTRLRHGELTVQQGPMPKPAQCRREAVERYTTKSATNTACSHVVRLPSFSCLSARGVASERHGAQIQIQGHELWRRAVPARTSGSIQLGRLEYPATGWQATVGLSVKTPSNRKTDGLQTTFQ